MSGSQDLFTSTATVFVLEEKNWIEKGSGMVKFIYDLTTFELRLVVHSADASNRRPFICRLKPKIRSKGPRAYVVRAYVSMNLKNEIEEGEHIVAIRFDREVDSSEFRRFVEERDGHNSNGFGVNPHPPFFPPESNYQDQPARKSASKPTPRADVWCCAMCTLLNEPSALVCAVCGARNPDSSANPPNPTTTVTTKGPGPNIGPGGSSATPRKQHGSSHHQTTSTALVSTSRGGTSNWTHSHQQQQQQQQQQHHHHHQKDSSMHRSSSRNKSHLRGQRESVGAAPPAHHQRLSISWQHQRNASQTLSSHDVVVLPLSEENLRKHDRVCPPQKRDVQTIMEEQLKIMGYY